MKKLQIGMIILFFLLLLLPIVFFNWEENVISPIDNRMLTNNPFGENTDSSQKLTTRLENYISDRIGFRSQMIEGYTDLNDRLFHKMIHPLYEYGKDGYVFSKAKSNIVFSDYHRDFAKMLAQIQSYCEQRGVPFLFVFNPEKAAVYTEYLADGICYDNSWVQEFEAELERLGVHYIDNTQLLREKKEAEEQVFNKQYNAGHWNDLGAFYGVNHILEELSKDFPSLQPNEKSDFAISEKLNETLPSSTFPIAEYEPFFGRKTPLEVKTPEYDAEIVRNNQHRAFGYYVNPEKVKEDAPKTLVFQGSYMNEMGFKFLQSGLGEYIYVHNYENLLDFDYYFNIFQPECVIVEAAEYTINPTYFNQKGVEDFSLNPKLELQENAKQGQLSQLNLQLNQGEKITNLTAQLPQDTQYAYLVVGETVFDCSVQPDGKASVSLENTDWNKEEASIVSVNFDGTQTVYR